MSINKILNDLYCKINNLKSEELTVLWNGSIIESSTASINFTGSAISNIETLAGNVLVQINGGEQIQSDWTQEDSLEPSFIQNKPNPTDLIFTGNVTTTQTGPNEITVDILGSSGGSITFIDDVTNPFVPIEYTGITELSLSGNANINITNPTPNRVSINIDETVSDDFWSKVGNASTSESSNFIGTTDLQGFTVRTNNVQRFRFNGSYTEFSPLTSSTYIAGGNSSIPAINGNLAIGLSNSKAMVAATADAYNNIALGAYALRRTTGYNNVFSGIWAGESLTFAKDSIGIGYFALRGNASSVSVDQSVCIGPYAMKNTINSLWSIAIGPGALENGTHHMQNIAIGLWALQNTTMNGDNISSNIAVGTGAAAFLTTGICNTIISSNRNVAFMGGAISGTDSWNVFIGERAGGEGGGGNKNVVIGAEAAGDVISGTRMRGERNILIGYNIGSTAGSQDGSILIGANILPQSTDDSILNIGNVIYGSGLYNESVTRSSTPTTIGRIGIGISSPTAVLDLRASTTADAIMRLRVGSAPTAPNDGDLWLENNTSTGLKIRLNGNTYTVNLV